MLSGDLVYQKETAQPCPKDVPVDECKYTAYTIVHDG